MHLICEMEQHTTPLNDAPFVLTLGEANQAEPQQELRAGDLCPKCGQHALDYDGMLNLACPQCGVALGGCFT